MPLLETPTTERRNPTSAALRKRLSSLECGRTQRLARSWNFAECRYCSCWPENLKVCRLEPGCEFLLPTALTPPTQREIRRRKCAERVCQNLAPLLAKAAFVADKTGCCGAVASDSDDGDAHGLQQQQQQQGQQQQQQKQQQQQQQQPRGSKASSGSSKNSISWTEPTFISHTTAYPSLHSHESFV